MSDAPHNGHVPVPEPAADQAMPTGDTSGAAGSPSDPQPPRMDESIEREVADAMAAMSAQDLADLTIDSAADIEPGGAIQLGRIEAVRGDDVFINLGSKSQGVLPRSQFKPDESLAVGEPVEVMIDRYDRESDLLILARKGQARTAEWGLLKVGDVVEGRIVGLNRGGLEVQLKGIKAFMPASQVDVVHLKDISIFLNEVVQCEVIEIDRKGRRMTVSRRSLIEKELAAKRAQLLEELEVGQVRKGIVGNLADFGAFVDLGGVDGLIHISDLSWTQVSHPSEVVKTGEVVEVKITRIQDDDNKKRISLSLKHSQPDPWDTVQDRFPVGSTQRVRVVRLADFGAFAELEKGIEGLIPLSEMSWRRIGKASEVVEVGQVVDVAVVRVEPKRRRISLSIKQASPDPWAVVMESYKPDTTVTGKVTKLADFGAFMEIVPGVEGLIHISELAPRRIKTCSEVVQVGQEVTARVLSVDAKARRISLSLKPAPVLSTGGAAPADAAQPPADGRSQKKKDRRLRGGLSSEWDWTGLGLDNLPSSRK